MADLKNFYRACILSILSAIILVPGLLFAQPSPGDLAERIDRANSERIAQINRITTTTEMIEGPMQGLEASTTYEKVQRNGRDVLRPVSEDGFEVADMSGQFDEVMGEMVRNASDITEERYEGMAVYRIFVDDSDFLKETAELHQLEDEFDEEETIPENVTIWLDRDDLIVHKIRFEVKVEETDNPITYTMMMDEYQSHSGLPIPHRTRIEIEGFEQMISDEELAEARRGMEELEEQLEQMPEAQREMIRRQLQPQIERFEQMLEDGSLGSMTVRITNVEVE